MRRRSIALAALLAAVAAGPIAGCEKNPLTPARTNPLDPENPATGGEPFHLRAVPFGPSVELSWNPVAIAGRSGYRIYRRVGEAADYALLQAVGGGETAFRDASPARDSVDHYLVTVLNARAEESPPSPGARDSVDVPPLLEIRRGDAGDEAAETTSVRAARVFFFSERAERVFLASALDSLSALGLAEPETLSPDPGGYAWTLPAGPGADGVKSVYGRILRRDATLSAITFDTIRENAIRLKIRVEGAAGDTARAGRRSVAVAIVSAVGAESLQVAVDPSAYGSWLPFVTPLVAPLPADSSGRRPLRQRTTLRVRAMNAFGVVDSAHTVVEVDTLASPRILLEAGAAQTRSAEVNVSVAGGIATAICLTNDSTAVACSEAFEPFDGIRERWPLDAAQRGGTARVFAFLANEWDTTAALVDSIFFLP